MLPLLLLFSNVHVWVRLCSVCLTIWDPKNCSPPAPASRSNLPHRYPIIALHLIGFPHSPWHNNFYLFTFTSIFTWEGGSSFAHPTHARPILCSFLIWASSNFRILWILLLSANGRNQQELRAGEEKENEVFLPHSLLALVSRLWQVAGSLHNDGSYKAALPPSFQFFFKKHFYLFIWLLQVLVEACRIFPCSIQALHCGWLAPECQGLNLHPPALEGRCLTAGPPGRSLHDSNS